MPHLSLNPGLLGDQRDPPVNGHLAPVHDVDLGPLNPGLLGDQSDPPVNGHLATVHDVHL
jgi:hypothetical protein